MKKIGLLLFILITLASCSGQDSTVFTPATDAGGAAESTTETKTDNSDFDLIDTWDTDTATKITFSDTEAQIDGPGAILTDAVLQIDQAGTYVLQGEFTGSVRVTLTKTEKAHIVLNGTAIRSDDTAAIHITSADKVVITLAPDTENTLSDGTGYAVGNGAEPNACLFSKDDLTINGTGTLNVFGNSNNGIGTKNDLKIISGTLIVNANKNALKGNDSVRIFGGNITVIICSDGVKSDNETEADKGFVTISGGTLQLNCADDGIQAVTGVTISTAASVTVTAVDKPVNCDGSVNIDEGCLIVPSSEQ